MDKTRNELADRNWGGLNSLTFMLPNPASLPTEFRLRQLQPPKFQYVLKKKMLGFRNRLSVINSTGDAYLSNAY